MLELFKICLLLLCIDLKICLYLTVYIQAIYVHVIYKDLCVPRVRYCIVFIFIMVYMCTKTGNNQLTPAQGWEVKRCTHHRGIWGESLANISWCGICCWPLDALFLPLDFPVTINPCSFKGYGQNYENDNFRLCADTGYINAVINRHCFPDNEYGLKCSVSWCVHFIKPSRFPALIVFQSLVSVPTLKVMLLMSRSFHELRLIHI